MVSVRWTGAAGFEFTWCPSISMIFRPRRQKISERLPCRGDRKKRFLDRIAEAAPGARIVHPDLFKPLLF